MFLFKSPCNVILNLKLGFGELFWNGNYVHIDLPEYMQQNYFKSPLTNKYN